MNIEPRRWLFRFLAIALACVGGNWAEAARLDIPAWTFDRGNAQVAENPDIYADYRDIHPMLMLTAGEKLPWRVEYDIEFPADGEYSLSVRYASPESRPVDVLLDDRKIGTGCGRITGNSGMYPDRYPKHDRPRRVENFHGAEWDEVCKFTAAEGKHTLSLARAAAPPRVIRLRLEADVAWKAAERKVQIDRIPPRYRTVFLPPGSVNIATLRLAIEDTVTEYGERYAKGPEYLKELADLEAARLSENVDSGPQNSDPQTGADENGDRHLAAASSEGEVGTQLGASPRFRELRRRAMLDHPLLKFDKLLFVKRTTSSARKIYHGDGGAPGGNLCVLSMADGKVTEIAPQLDGGLFGQFDLSFDAKKIVFAHAKPGEPFRIFEIGIDGNSLRQLTFDAPEGPAETGGCLSGCGKAGYDDMDPCYLPNGKIAFVSNRRHRVVFCAGDTVTTLHLMDGDGANVRCLSEGPITEIDPTVMNDGRIIHMRWEYVDKGFGNVQSIWSMRPDGSHSDHVYKNSVILPAGMVDPRSIPGSRKIVTIGAPHGGALVGPVVLVDTRKTRRGGKAMTNITPEIGQPGMFHFRDGHVHGFGQSFETFGYFKEPYPLSEKLFLVSHSLSKNTREPKGYGIYVLDKWGNRAELYRDPETSCFQPFPLRPRRRPAEIPAVAALSERTSQAGAAKLQRPATLFLQDVYRGLTGIKRGRVKYLRIMEAFALHRNEGGMARANLQVAAVSLRGDVHLKKVHGIVPVYEDGSAFLAVPPRKNLYFQALDENYMELQRMRSFINLMPGERRSCIGCHEMRRNVPGAVAAHPMAFGKGPSTPMPQPGDSGPHMIHYATDIQPILNRRCVGCHTGPDAKGDLVLSGEPTLLWNRSYENIINKDLVSYLNGCYGCANVPPELPLTFGSHQSKMVERILKAPCRSDITREEFIAIVTWVDANAPYYGTHSGKKTLDWKDDPKFRMVPLAAE